jgi:hypothetical protein
MAHAAARLWLFALGAVALWISACHEAEPPARSDASDTSHAGDAAAPGSDAGSSPHDAAPASSDAADAAPALDAASDAAPPLDADADAASAALDAEAGSMLDAGTPNDASAPADAQPPGQPPAPSVKQLALGRAHGCSLDPAIDGLLCWGDNARGQTAVPSLGAPSFVATGGDVTCVIDRGDVRCWGDASHGQLAVPAALGTTAQLAVGDSHVCALSAAGAVRCWGDDAYGQLQVPALSGVRALGAGLRHSCALTADGVRCWGDGARHQLEVPALANPSQLAVGGFHNCAIDGAKLACWGGEVPALLQIPSVQSPWLIAAGRSHSCVLDAAGVHCWGDPAAGSLAPRELTRVQQLAVGGGEGFAHACVRHQQGIACWGDDRLKQTQYDGGPLHRLFRAQAEIAAPSSVVWGVLMDLDNYGLWNPYTIAMKSTLKVPDPMVMTVKMNDLVTIEQTENIRVLEDGHKICWGIDTDTPELNSGERCQWLEPLADGGTRYVTEDLIEGTLNPLVSVLFGEDVRVGFNGVASGLKARAEALHKP